MRFLDTNIVIRYIVQPPSPIEQNKHLATVALVQQIQRGGFAVRVTESVLTEVLYVLCSPRLYGLNHQDAAAHLAPLIRLRGVHIPGKQTYLQALAIFATNNHLDIEDAIIVAMMEREREQELYSYDTGFDRVQNITRLVP